MASTACLMCAPDTYQVVSGSAVCRPCSSSAKSLEGADVCTCTGKNRMFQPGNGWCICKSGYEFVDLNYNLQSEADGKQDCQPVVYDRCDEGQLRAPTGDCVNENVLMYIFPYLIHTNNKLKFIVIFGTKVTTRLGTYL